MIRLNANDAEPYEDQRLEAPGVGTQSEAEEHLKKMVENQLNTNISLERYSKLVCKYDIIHLIG